MLHGRDAEVELLRARLRTAREGGSFALVVAGEAGIGKTALLDAAAGEATGFRVLQARGFEGDAEIPYAGLLEIAGPLLDLSGALPEQQRTALRSALAIGPASEPPRFAVPVAVLALLGLAAEEQPVLVVVDDAHWLDVATREALLFAARRLRAAGVGFLLGARTGVAAFDVEFAGLEVLELGGIDAPGARLLLGDRVAPSVADALTAATGGNPLALLELPAVLSEDERRGLRPITVPVAVGDLVDRVFRDRIAALPDAARRAAGVAAAAEDGRLDQIIRASARLGLSESDLDPAEAAGILAIRGVQVVFQHPLVRAAAYRALTVTVRRAVHAALADESDDARAAAWHRAQAAAGPDEAVAAALAGVAEDALRRGGRDEAAQTYARAADLTPDPGTAALRRLAGAAAAHEAGDAARALALLDAAERGPLDDDARGEARRVRALVAMVSGDAETGVRLLEEEAARLRDRDPVRAGRTLLLAAPAHMHNGDFVPLHDSAERARALIGDADPGAAAAAADVSLMATILLGTVDDPAAQVAVAGRDVLGEMGIIALAGTDGLSMAERSETSLALLDGHVERARSAGAVVMLLYALTVRTRLHHRVGRWPAARADAEEAVELQRGVGRDTMFANYLYGAAALLHADLGNLGDAERLAAESMGAGRRSGSQATMLWAHWSRGRIALLQRRIPEAVEALTDVEALAARLQWTDEVMVEARADLGAAHAAAGDLDGVRAVAGRLRRGRPPTRLGSAVAARLEGQLASDDDFEAAFSEALAAHDAITMPFERARTLLALSARRRRARGRATAREPAQEALAVFERLGATPWAALAAEELRLGGTARPALTAAGAAEALTGQEWRVAELAIKGMTNREIGGALFVSPKTVEHHLGAIYRKLGVRSRTELAGALSGASASASPSP